MKTNNRLTNLAAGLFLVTLMGLASCSKDKSESALTPEEERQAVMASSESEAEADAFSNDIFDDVMGVNDEVGMSGTGIFGGRVMQNGRVDSAPPCVQITVTHLNAPDAFPLRIVMDFGTGCTGRDGRVRSGQIITTYTGRLIVPGKSATTTFHNYKVDSISVEGTHKITNTSTSNHRQFTVGVENGKLSRPSGNYVQWNSHRVITQAEGLGTPLLPVDDVFTITGHSRGTVKRNNLITVWESAIEEPLRKRFNCRWIVKGTVRTVRSNQASNTPWTAILNYGQGDCDNRATLNINGVDHQINLR